MAARILTQTLGFFLLFAAAFASMVPTPWISFAYATTKKSFLMMAVPEEGDFCYQVERPTFDNATIRNAF
ncbi:unnamed protein product, partial [Mesorhabditis spiculigera]